MSASANGASQFVCPDCGSQHLRRLPRQGFLQKKVYTFFGYFPWECPICREVKLFRKRGKRSHREAETE
jgi:predicted RNA-binding Zn-ribbon protein involved in translation (DUF1610 family)